jgi:SagB-type dehydrogenase family enzyme
VTIDRRAFLALLGGVLGWAGGTGCAESTSPASALDLHRMTRNTWLGALGVRPALRGRPVFKPYPGATRRSLPPVPPRGGASLEAVVRGYEPATGFAPETLSIDELAWVLHLTNGVTARWGTGPSEVALRAAPSAGALYAGEVYVVAQRVSALERGIYYYAVMEHALVPVRSGLLLEQIAATLERPSALEGAAAAVVLTNVFARYARRYANRGYRYSLIDSGHIGANLRLAAQALGLGVASPARYEDDALNRLLDIDGRREAVCALHGLGRRGTASTRGAERPLVPTRVRSAELQPGREDAIERGHEATKLVPGPAHAGGDASLAEPLGSGLAARALPAARSVDVPLEHCIKVRRSASRFLARPISLEDLAFVLEIAAGHRALERAPGLEVWLVVHRVRDLAPGLYRYDGTRHALDPLREGDMRTSMTRACLAQRKAGSAAVGFVLAGRLESARSYRDLLLEAGEVAQRVYLAAEALGLAARNLAAFVDDTLDALAGLDGRTRAAVHLTMLGAGD